jgi:hypothetical protein
MAAVTGVSKSTVQRVWSARGLKPHRVEAFKLSQDPKFEKLPRYARWHRPSFRYVGK